MKDHKPSKHLKEGGFKVYRNQSSFEFPQKFLYSFGQQYPGYMLYPKSSTVLDVVRRRETRVPIMTSRRLGMVSLDNIVERIMLASPASAAHRIELPASRLQFVPNKDGSHRIHLLVDDLKGDIEEERRSYFDQLERITGVPFDAPALVPSLEIGRTKKSADLSLEALRALTRFIPDLVYLQPALPHPRPPEALEQAS